MGFKVQDVNELIQRHFRASGKNWYIIDHISGEAAIGTTRFSAALLKITSWCENLDLLGVILDRSIGLEHCSTKVHGKYFHQ